MTAFEANPTSLRPMPRRGRPSPEQSAAITEAIVNTATALFLQDGFEGTSMEAVAAEVGIPKRTLYKRFTDKAELLDAVLKARVRAWSSVSSQQNATLSADLPLRLKQYVATMLVWAGSPEVRTFSRLFAIAEGLSRIGQDRFDFSGRAEMVSLIAHDIKAFGSAQGIHAQEPLRVARIIMAQLTGWLALRGDDAPITCAEATLEAGYLVDVLMQGAKAW